MKPKYWAIILLAVAAVCAGAFYYLNQPALDLGPVVVHHKSKTIPSSSPTDTSGTTSPSGLSAEALAKAGVEGWKTYTNSKYGFSFEYPADWTSSSTQAGGFVVWFNSPETSRAQQDYFESPSDLTVYIDNNQNHLTAQNFYNGDSGVALFDVGNQGQQINVSGNVAYKVYPTEGMAPSVDVVIPQKNYFLHFETYGDETVLNQILTTFKFTPTS